MGIVVNSYESSNERRQPSGLKQTKEIQSKSTVQKLKVKKRGLSESVVHHTDG